MKINRQQFLEQGYLILRNVIPPDKLDELRTSYEILVERQKAIWARDRQPGDPPGGVWETAPQPRLRLHDTPELIDEETASAIEFWLHENTLGVSSQLLNMPETAHSEMFLLCSPGRDHGPAKWHRDIHPIDTAPLEGYLKDLLENGPRHLQWNIALYDDNVLWVIPGSHHRLNTEEENRMMLGNPRAPLPGGVAAELKAGDGVVYISPGILHWGSNYSSKLRRTIHGNYANLTCYQDLSYTRHLCGAAQATFQRWAERSRRMQDLTESALRAAMQKDAVAYRENLDKLQPGIGEEGKLLLTVFLSKAVILINLLKHPDPVNGLKGRRLEDVPADLRRWVTRAHPNSLNWGPQFAARFSQEESQVLWERFKTLDAKLQADEENFAPGFLSEPMRYYFNEMPADLDMENFIASWGE